MKTKRQSQSDNGGERAAFLQELFRQLPDKKFSLRHLASASGGATKEGRRQTLRIVEQLMADGFVEECSPGKYRLCPARRPRLEGVVEMLANGSMFVRVDGTDEPVYIHARNSLNALDGDRVEVTVTRKARGENAPEGEVAAIVERSRKRYVGSVQAGGHSIFVHVDSRRMPVDIYLRKHEGMEVRDGDKVVVRIVEWQPGAKSPVGELVDILGRAGDNDTEMHAILAEYDLPYRFEPEVEAAAEAIAGTITEQDYAERRDFRRTTTFTIDPADAKDFDDALSIRKLRDGVWEVGVHIADVTHYVRPGSVVDTEAEARGTSVYLVDRTVPMLPERLSNELCSLRPHEESLCFSAVFTLDEQLDILDEWFGRTVIYSDRRFSYEEAQQVIETGQGDYADEILTLNRLAQAMRRERFRHGAIGFDRAEAKFRLDEKGRPLGVSFKEQKEANQLIEEFMLLANRRVAEFCGKVRGRKSKRTMVYRVHDEPNADKLQSFRQFILRFGHVFKASEGRPVAKEMNRLFEKVKGRPEENAVATLAVRSMAKAYYTTDNIGHYGLAFPYYTHFTSPIRRYPDMMVHRLLARYLEGGRTADKTKIEGLCEHASTREVVAAEAERASIKYKMVEFMQARLGEEFAGHISGITEWGIFVEIDDNRIEGLVSLRDLHDDFYEFNPAEYTATGRSTGRRFTLGDAVRIRVKRADLQKRQLDFELILPDASPDASPDLPARKSRRTPSVKRRR